MNYYIRFPSDDKIHILNERCGDFKAHLILETIKKLEISENDKQKTLEHALSYLKEHQM